MTDFGLQWVLSVISMLLLVIYRFHIIDHNVSWWLQILRQTLDSGKSLPFPDGVLINGQGHTTFNGDQGCLLHLAKHFCVSLKNKVHSINTSLPTIVPFFFFGLPGKTYMFRISNVGLSTSFNFRIQGHTMKLVEVEGSHTIQNIYDSLDVHVGQSVSVLVTFNQPPKDYYIVASTRFTKNVLTATAVLHYTNSHSPASGPLPTGPTYEIHWSMKQARTFRYQSL